MQRRSFLSQSTTGLGSAALASLLSADQTLFGVEKGPAASVPHFAPKAKRIIYLFQSGWAIANRSV